MTFINFCINYLFAFLSHAHLIFSNLVLLWLKCFNVACYCLSFIGYFLWGVGRAAWSAGMGEENDIKLLSFREGMNWKLHDKGSCLGSCCHLKSDISYSPVNLIACTVWWGLLLASPSYWSLLAWFIVNSDLDSHPENTETHYRNEQN